MKQTSHKTLIGSFLIIGTLLALYITIDGAYDLYWVHNTWMYRDGLIQKIGFVAISADFALISIAGLVSTVSFFIKKRIWKPITKGIAVNVLLWLIVVGIMFCLWPLDLIVKICGLLIIGVFAWMILRIWNMIK